MQCRGCIPNLFGKAFLERQRKVGYRSCYLVVSIPIPFFTQLIHYLARSTFHCHFLLCRDDFGFRNMLGDQPTCQLEKPTCSYYGTQSLLFVTRSPQSVASCLFFFAIVQHQKISFRTLTANPDQTLWHNQAHYTIAKLTAYARLTTISNPTLSGFNFSGSFADTLPQIATL